MKNCAGILLFILCALGFVVAVIPDTTVNWCALTASQLATIPASYFTTISAAYLNCIPSSSCAGLT
jgi:hypothetical protein